MNSGGTSFVTFFQNAILSGDIPFHMQGTNVLPYETAWHVPTGQYRYVGNHYWNCTGPDANGDFIGDTPARVGTGSDPYPLLYGGLDNDGDGLYNAEELGDYHTDPNLADTDGDGWSDQYEVKVTGTNPLSRDSDGDGKDDSIDTTPGYSDPDDDVATIYAPLVNALYIAAGIIGGALVLFSIAMLVSTRRRDAGKARGNGASQQVAIDVPVKR
jgi:hypothetical protein